jgi:hypothetical protein
MDDHSMPNYSLDENDNFLIKDYQNVRPFASFLPGIAGPMGIPLWVFYVNRGQAIASFGVENKDKPILEYQPANRAYQLTSFLGFRTFIRMEQGNKRTFFEPFAVGSPFQTMSIGMNELSLSETSHRFGLQIEVVYFLLPGENLAGLVRMVTLTNRSSRPMNIEMLDGLPAVIPFGVNNQVLKEIGRTVEAWMEVYNLSQKVPYYHLRASVADTTEVSSFDAGHYLLAFKDENDGSVLQDIIVDPSLVFGNNSALLSPDFFTENGLNALLAQKQITSGRTPCGFATLQVELPPGGSVHLNSIYGHVSQLENVQSKIKLLTSKNYLVEKRIEARELIRNITDGIFCRSGSHIFDAYCRQTFLDNILRGGMPAIFDQTNGGKSVYHIYSRKHGDLERDYNAFSSAPEFFSQGNGSYRDINQNRREDAWFFPAISDFNIQVFMSLIQADGYNPLVVQGSYFTVSHENLEGLLSFAKEPEKLRKLLSAPFSPGSLLRIIFDESIRLNVNVQTFLKKVMEKSEQHISASSGEGYWVDHWTYNLDLIEGFLSVYPDRKEELLFSNENILFYENALIVRPRSEKYVLVNGNPCQIHSLVEDDQKAAMLKARGEEPCWVRTKNGSGAIYSTSLFAKLFGLALLKFATLDPWGMGIAMEAGRPGWDDAMNGLPGLFGSSMAETYSLKWLLSFLLASLENKEFGFTRLPIEMAQFLRRVVREVRHFQSSISSDRDWIYWDNVSRSLERYRARIRLGFDGEEQEIAFSKVKTILELFHAKVDSGIVRAEKLAGGLPPTFFIFQVEEYDGLTDKNGLPKNDLHGRPLIQIKRFSPKPLPLFLEGIVKALRVMDTTSAETLYEQVKASSLYDCKLKMYRINASLEDYPLVIGRVRAFPAGWLENESVWLHMEYKYLLEVLRAGLYTHFFEDFKAVLIPFRDPTIYGRSPLENSSFIVSSAHPDERLHGAGFVARLSGASAEFLSIWRRMMAGEKPFFVKDHQIHLAFAPILPAWLFNVDNTISFRFLGKALVTYHNPGQLDTFDKKASIRSTTLRLANGDLIEFEGGIVPPPFAQNVRDGLVSQIDVYIDL